MASFLRSIFNTKPNQPSIASRFLNTTAVKFSDAGMINGKTHKVSNFEKRILVWAGKFKSVNDVPAMLA